MRRLLLMMMACGMLLAAASAGAQEVNTPVGDVGVSTVAKFVYAWSEKDNDTRWPGMEQFSSTMVDLRLDGMLTDQISYHIELCSSWNLERGFGGLTGISTPGEQAGSFIGIRQASIVFDEMIPWTRIEAGTFIPPIGNYMPRSVSNLDFINYPLIANASGMDLDVFGDAPPFLPTTPWPGLGSNSDNRPFARDFGIWQQAGLNVTVTTPYMVQIDLGLWNGMMPTRTGNVNPEKAMAQSFILTFSPDPTISLSAAVWNEQFDPTYTLTNGTAGSTYNQNVKRNLTIWTVYGSYINENLEVTADYSQGIIPNGQITYRGNTFTGLTNEFYDLTWEGWQMTVGYWFLPQLELLFRLEQFDPNTQDSVKIAESRYDQSTWYTMGLNYRLFERMEISLNYIIKNEEGRDLDRNEPGEDPMLPGYNPRYSATNNDEFLLQVMVWQ